MDQDTAELCASHLRELGVTGVQVRLVEGVQLEPGTYEYHQFERGRGRYEVVAYLPEDEDDTMVPLFSIQAYTPFRW